jgi:hypothetical protein
MFHLLAIHSSFLYGHNCTQMLPCSERRPTCTQMLLCSERRPTCMQMLPCSEPRPITVIRLSYAAGKLAFLNDNSGTVSHVYYYIWVKKIYEYFSLILWLTARSNQQHGNVEWSVICSKFYPKLCECIEIVTELHSSVYWYVSFGELLYKVLHYLLK